MSARVIWKAAVILLAGLLLGGCKAQRREVVVFAAASLTRALADLEPQIEKAHPDLDVRVELSGSQEACRKVAELGRRADVVATADYRVIDGILRPGHAAFNIKFTTNEIVIAHLQHSKHTDQITADNWPSILARPDVRLGLADRDLAPIGYATILVCKLAEQQLGADRVGGPGLEERLRARCAREHVTSDESELLRLLQSRAIDYTFMYRSTAEEHNLKTVTLPDAYNLGAADKAALYARAAVQVKMARSDAPREIRGAPITYGVTIPTGAPNADGAARVLQHLLGEEGQRTMKRTGFRPIVPAICGQRSQLPDPLKPLTRD
jgi:molybdate/tungstate transport system substrate-binding protein